MTDSAARQSTSTIEGVGSEAILRILEIARLQAGTDAAFVIESSEAAVVRFIDGDPASLPTQSGALALIIAAVLDGEIPSVVPDAAYCAPLRNAGVTGALVSVPIPLPDGSMLGLLGCISRLPIPQLAETDEGMIRVLARAIGRLAEQHDLIQTSHHRAEIDRIRVVLDGTGLEMVFQPIMDLDTRIPVGYEALARFASEPQRTPDRWFAEAARVDLGTDLEMAAVNAALRSATTLPAGTFLSINASTATVIRPEFLTMVAGLRPGRLVIELTDHARIEDDRAIGKALASLGISGVLIATDVSDAGFETLSQVLQLAPDIIKLDGILVRGIDTDPVRHALAQTVVAFASGIGAVVVGESIQTESELAMLRALGIRRGQGHLLAAPGPLP